MASRALRTAGSVGLILIPFVIASFVFNLVQFARVYDEAPPYSGQAFMNGKPIENGEVLASPTEWVIVWPNGDALALGRTAKFAGKIQPTDIVRKGGKTYLLKESAIIQTAAKMGYRIDYREADGKLNVEMTKAR